MKRVSTAPKPVIRTGQLTTFLMCFALSVALVAFSAFFIKTHVGNGPVVAKVTQIGARACAAAVHGHGFTFKQRGTMIVAFAGGLDDISDHLLGASQAISSCVGFKLANFCAGAGCGRPGVSFTLTELQATEGATP